MKLDPAQLDPRALPHLVKTLNVRATKWGIVVQRRPRPGSRKFSKLQRQWQTAFGIAARMASSPHPIEYQTAIEMAKGTQQTPRDILTMAALGSYYVVRHPDGTEWPKVPGPIVGSTDPNAPPIEPPIEKTRWAEMNWNLWDQAWNTSTQTAAYAFKGGFFTPHIEVNLKGVGSVLTAYKAGQYRAAIGRAQPDGTITEVIVTDGIIPPRDGRQSLFWTLETTLLAETEYFLLIGRADQTPTHALPIAVPAGSAWLWPCRRGVLAQLASTTPAVGQVIARHTSEANPPLGLDF